MNDDVRFAPGDGLYAWGKNGLVNSTGIYLSHHDYNAQPHIEMRNINSKGDVSEGARLSLPVTAIPELIAILQRMYAGPLGKLALDMTSTATVEEP